MKTPRFLMGAALLFWGWVTGLWIFAMFMTVILEGSRAVAWRLDLEEKDYNRLWDLCAILFSGVAIYCYMTEEPAYAIYRLVQWLPLIFFPFMFAQAFGTLETIPFRTFSWLARSKAAAQEMPLGASLNVSYPYFALALIAAGSTNQRARWFYFVLCLILATTLWLSRPKRFSEILWFSLIAAVAVLGYFTHLSLHQLHVLIERKSADWLAEFSEQGANADESRTAIGSLGKLKLSGKVVLRLQTEGKPPELLRQAVYNTFNRTVWYAADHQFQRIFPESDGVTWKLSEVARKDREVSISGLFKGSSALLPQPRGSFQFSELLTPLMETNRLGACRITLFRNYLHYTTHYGEETSLDAPPGSGDRLVPSLEKPALDNIVQKLEILPGDVNTAMAKISRFFDENFRYSTYNDGSVMVQKGETPLTTFLERRRSGHCEYFATATVLLLREAGIPARYVTGYSVQEQASPHRYLVRGRHAHSWASLFDGAKWIDFDTTPAEWVAVEEKNSTLWEPISDLWSRGWFAFSQWRTKEKNLGSLVWLLIPVLLFVCWRFLRVRKKRVRIPGDTALAGPKQPQIDSDFYLIEKKLSAAGYSRHPWETLKCWAERLHETTTIQAQEFLPILDLHYRLRFDPQGLSENQMAELKTGVKRWLESYSSSSENVRS